MRKKRGTPRNTDMTPGEMATDVHAARKRAERELKALAATKHEIAELQEAAKEREAKLLDIYEDLGEKSISVTTSSGEVITGTMVQGERVVFNDAALKKSLGAAMWNKVTERVLDKRKLEDQIAAGKVETADVAAASKTTKNKPYVKVTRK